jgi:hypothetical protein
MWFAPGESPRRAGCCDALSFADDPVLQLPSLTHITAAGQVSGYPSIVGCLRWKIRMFAIEQYCEYSARLNLEALAQHRQCEFVAIFCVP